MRTVILTAVAVFVFVGCGEKESSSSIQGKTDIRISIENDKNWQKEYMNYKFPTVKQRPVEIEQKYSEFDNRSSYTTKFFPFHNDALLIMFFADGKKTSNVKPPAEVLLAFDKLLVTDFRFKADGQEIEPRRQRGNSYRLLTKDLLKIIYADRVLVKINADEFVLSKSEKQMFYNVASVMGN